MPAASPQPSRSALRRADRHRLSRLPEAHISELHRAALKRPDSATAITNVLIGRPARAILNRFIAEQGPVNAEAPAFPLATEAAIPLRTIAEGKASATSVVRSGQAAFVGRDMNADDLTHTIAEESLGLLAAFGLKHRSEGCHARAQPRASTFLASIPAKAGIE